MRISVVTVAHNRTPHLLACAKHLSAISLHEEHLILDLGSSPAVERSQLPDDPRIRLISVVWQEGWWLTHSYNLAFSLACGDYILKLDADVLVEQDFADELLVRMASSSSDLMCGRLTLQEWALPTEQFITNGLFLCRRTSLEALRGFNPYLRGWGWDEIDLYSRFFMAGFPVSRLPERGVKAIDHGDDQRQRPREGMRVSAKRLMKAHDKKNKCIAVSAQQRQLIWPSFEAYRHAFHSDGSLPLVARVALLSEPEQYVLARRCVKTLLDPGTIQDIGWRWLARLGSGPYSRRGAASLLEACGIDLSLVT